MQINLAKKYHLVFTLRTVGHNFLNQKENFQHPGHTYSLILPVTPWKHYLYSLQSTKYLCIQVLHENKQINKY